MLPARTAASDPQSHIIERPRLLKKLDEAPGRLILLVAPAGYGKTTLARSWTATHRTTWFDASAADRDIAALARGLSLACEQFVPDCSRRLRERLSAARTPADDARALADLLAEDLAGWPSDAWVVLDNHHQLALADGAETFVETLFDCSTIQLLIAARIRPSWITPRRVIYGEVLDVDQTNLAMDEGEARELLKGVRADQVDSLIETARGWPAVLGLATRVPDPVAAEGQLPRALYEFFAEELYGTLAPSVRLDLQALALVSRLKIDRLQELIGPGFDELLAVSARVGFVEIMGEHVEIHPLLRAFLEQQLRRGQFRSVVDAAVDALASNHVWDEAFDLALRFDYDNALMTLIERASEHLLDDGMVTTLSRWISTVRTRHLSSDSVDLAEAEVELRQGRFQTAEFLAIRVARASSTPSRVAAAYAVAGSAAHIGSSREALDHYSAALKHSADPRTTRRARIGQFLSALEFEPESARNLFDRLEDARDADATTTLRLLGYRVMYERRVGDLRGAVRQAEAGERLLGQVDDPMARTAYLHSLAFGYSELARYDRARQVAKRLLDEGAAYRLAFIASYGNFVFAVASLGLKQYRQALAACDRAESTAAELGLIYGELNARILMSRIRLAMGDTARARELLETDFARSPLPALTAEFVMAKAFLSAVMGEEDRARHLLALPSGHFLDGLVMSIRDATEAILAVRSSDQIRAASHVESILKRGQLDTLISMFRADPDTLHAAKTLASWRGEVGNILVGAREANLGRRVGILTADDVNAPISEREAEVLGLLAQGLRNREIAHRLFISEVTVKAHLRQVFRKLGVKSRTEAVIASEAVLDQATSAADKTREATDGDDS